MFERVLLGVGRRVVPLPECFFRLVVRRDGRKLTRRSRLEPDERRVHHFAVREIPRRRVPIAPATFAAELGLPPADVVPILAELERRMTFLCRRGGDDVVWAYPVTAETTCHQVTMEDAAAFSAD